jgi:uncharacterized small protein (DUF1192 family)
MESVIRMLHDRDDELNRLRGVIKSHEAKLAGFGNVGDEIKIRDEKIAALTATVESLKAELSKAKSAAEKPADKPAEKADDKPAKSDKAS